MEITTAFAARYRRPNWIERRIVNPILTYVVKHFGRAVRGACVLSVQGRRTGRPREVVVFVLGLYGDRFLVAPRGETEWVRNLRCARTATLRRGARQEIVRAAEVADDAKPPILRAYLRRWRRIAGHYFDVVGPDVRPDELRRIAPNHPVFRLSHRSTGQDVVTGEPE
jgi:hypothetical protein